MRKVFRVVIIRVAECTLRSQTRFKVSAERMGHHSFGVTAVQVVAYPLDAHVRKMNL